MRIMPVLYGDLAAVTPHILPYLHMAVEANEGRCTPDDLMASLYAKQYRLWVFMDEKDIVRGIMMCEGKEYPCKRMLRVVNVMTDPDVVAGNEELFAETIEAIARGNKCDGVEFLGRLGWGKMLGRHHEYTQVAQFTKMFAGEDHGL